MSTLSREVYAIQNPALCAVLLWRFTCAYNQHHPNRDHAPLLLLFIVLPMVLHRATLDVIVSTRNQSGLRACVAKFSASKENKQDIVLGIHDRAGRLRQLSLDAIKTAVSTRLLHVDPNSRVIPLSLTEPSASFTRPIMPLISGAERLGFWFSQLSIHEIAVILKVRF